MNRIIYDSTERDADLLYATGFSAPDAFLYFEKNGKKFIALNSLEYDRGKKEARVDQVINQTEFSASLRKKHSKPLSSYQWILSLLQKHQIKSAEVSSQFPLGLADFLRKGGIQLQAAETCLFPQRAIKTSLEVKHICHSLKATAELLKASIEMIRSSKPGKNHVLYLHGSPLTSERVQALIRMEASKRGFKADDPIVAGGVQGCDPHERGHGKLYANQLIILDIFPRDLNTGYWGDMTRTVVKGKASEAQRKLFSVVKEGQKLALSKIKNGINGRTVHEAIQDLFKKNGYETSNQSGRYEGFFHGTGHGLGLEIHEAPRVSQAENKLKTGHVVTVEPGLYYTQIGGVRIEDVALVKPQGCQVLSNFPVPLEI